MYVLELHTILCIRQEYVLHYITQLPRLIYDEICEWQISQEKQPICLEILVKNSISINCNQTVARIAE